VSKVAFVFKKEWVRIRAPFVLQKNGEKKARNEVEKQ